MTVLLKLVKILLALVIHVIYMYIADLQVNVKQSNATHTRGLETFT